MHVKKILSLAVSGAILFAANGMQAQASSHREAPFITEQPKVDGTDWYAFNSYEAGRAGFVTLIADYVPLQDSYGGPNYFAMDPEALYEMHIDNNGDAKEDITFQFRFQDQLRDIKVPTTANNVNGGTLQSIPLDNAGAIGPGITTADPAITTASNTNLNFGETYTLRVVRGDRRSGFSNSALATRVGAVAGANADAHVFNKPVDYIGTKSIPNYETYANNHIFDVSIPGCTTNAATQGRVFVGQRKEPFYFNIGETFDLLNLNPVGPRNSEPNPLSDKNITSLALEVPASCLVGDASKVIGSWTTSSLRQGRLLNPNPGSNINSASEEGGAYSQVSRLGMPIVNEVVIGLKDKNKFNSSKPVNDGANFLSYVTHPTLPVLVNILFPGVTPPPVPRTDLVAVFLTGVPGVNQPTSIAAGGGTPGEMLRLNTAIPATAAANQNDLGAAQCFVNGVLTLANPGCDAAGFPNGRRPIDDVIDISLRAAEGVLLPGTHNPAADRGTDGTRLPGAAAGRGAAADFKVVFPYLNTPLPGSPNGLNGQPKGTDG